MCPIYFFSVIGQTILLTVSRDESTKDGFTAGNLKDFTAIMSLCCVQTRGVRQQVRHVIVAFLFYVKIKMADNKSVFERAMFTALTQAESELRKEKLDSVELGKALKELQKLVKPVANNHFGEFRHRFNNGVGNFVPILSRMANKWYKQFMRRMGTRCSVKNPWKVVLDVGIPVEIFTIIKDVVSESNFCVYTHETRGTKSTRKMYIVAFTSRLRVANFFLRLMQSDMPKQDFLRKTFKTQKCIQAIVSDEKQFGITYNFNKELCTFEFFYGFWNDHGFPQHL